MTKSFHLRLTEIPDVLAVLKISPELNLRIFQNYQSAEFALANNELADGFAARTDLWVELLPVDLLAHIEAEA